MKIWIAALLVIQIFFVLLQANSKIRFRRVTSEIHFYPFVIFSDFL
jgi:hypothetical protein